MKFRTKLLAAVIYSLFTINSLFAQDLVLQDSLQNQLKNAQSDSLKALLHSELCYNWCGVNFDSAWNHANLSHRFALSSKSHQMIRLGIISKGWVYDWFYQYDSAIYYYNQAYTYSLKNDDLKGMATTLFNIGVVFYYLGNLDSAIHYYQASEPIFEQTGDELNLSRLYNNMGRIYEKAHKYELALDLGRRSIKIKKKLNNVRGLLNTYTNMSSIFQQLGAYDSALVYSDRCIASARHIGDITAYKHEYINLGIIYKNLNEYDRAIEAFLEAESLIIVEDDPYFLSQIYLNLGDFYLNKNETKLVANYLQKLEKLINEEEKLEITIHYYQLNHKYFKSIGDFKSANASLEKFIQLNTKFVDQATREKTTELEQLYNKEKRESEIARLNLDNENQRAEIAIKNNERNVLISATIIVFLLMGFIFYRYRANIKTTSLLESKNQVITAALDERELLLKEIHHRVKNNLQIISSLLNLQADSLSDQAAIDAVREGQSRVKSMALIHHKLYSANDIRGIDTQDYLEKLTSELFKAYGINENEGDYIIETGGIKLDIDTVIPLGLILNELITNALKYGFDKLSMGRLKIEIYEEGDKLFVTIKDNGKGMSEEDMMANNSFGWKMIRSLSRKLKAEIITKNENGTMVKLILSHYKLVR